MKKRYEKSKTYVHWAIVLAGVVLSFFYYPIILGVLIGWVVLLSPAFRLLREQAQEFPKVRSYFNGFFLVEEKEVQDDRYEVSARRLEKLRRAEDLLKAITEKEKQMTSMYTEQLFSIAEQESLLAEIVEKNQNIQAMLIEVEAYEANREKLREIARERLNKEL